jgi:hypothetical protein
MRALIGTPASTKKENEYDETDIKLIDVPYGADDVCGRPFIL